MPSDSAERLAAIAAAAMQVDHALRRYSVTLIETPIALRPAVQPDGRVLVTLEALVRLARSADPVRR